MSREGEGGKYQNIRKNCNGVVCKQKYVDNNLPVLEQVSKRNDWIENIRGQRLWMSMRGRIKLLSFVFLSV